MKTEKQLSDYLVALLPLSGENFRGTRWPWAGSWFTLLGHWAAEWMKQWERKTQLLLIKCNVGAWFTRDLTTAAVSNRGCHPSWAICRYNSTAHGIKWYFLVWIYEIAHYRYIAVKAKCKHADPSMWNLIQIPQVLLRQGSVLGSSWDLWA